MCGDWTQADFERGWVGGLAAGFWGGSPSIAWRFHVLTWFG